MRVYTLAGLGLLLASCATPYQDGERLYHEGDRLGALERWRAVPEDSKDSGRSHARIAEVEPEFERLVVQYKERAREHEGRGQGRSRLDRGRRGRRPDIRRAWKRHDNWRPGR